MTVFRVNECRGGRGRGAGGVKTVVVKRSGLSGRGGRGSGGRPQRGRAVQGGRGGRGRMFRGRGRGRKGRLDWADGCCHYGVHDVRWYSKNS